MCPEDPLLFLWDEQEELFLLCFPEATLCLSGYVGCTWHTMFPDRARGVSRNASQQDINVTGSLSL